MKTPLGAATAAALLGIGFAAYEVLQQAPGVGFSLVAAIGLALVFALARPKPLAVTFFALALIFAALLAVRASLVWQFFDLSAALALAVVAASYAQEESPATGTVRGWILRGFGIFSAIPEAFAYFVPPHPPAGTLDKTLRVGRTVAISGVLLLVFGALLASADAVFAETVAKPFQWDIDLQRLPQTIVGTILATGCAAVLLAYATRRRRFKEGRELSVRLPMGRIEWIAALSSVGVLFAAFVVIQFPYLFGGVEQISVPGMTYAEYARSGFMQMILAAVLTLVLVGAAWLAWGRTDPSPTAFRLLSSLLLALNLVVLASAFKRLTLYESAYGWTELRFIAHAIILWLAVFLVLSLSAIAVRRTSWLSPAAAVLSVVALLGINALNPDAFIAEKNIERYSATGKLDAYYLSTLSPDATPTLVAALDELPQRAGEALGVSLAACYSGANSGPWYSWNLGRARAEASIKEAGLVATGEGRACSVRSF